MKVVYLAFPLALMIFIMALRHPENIGNPLGKPTGETEKIIHVVVLGVVVFGVGCQFAKQAYLDLKSRWGGAVKGSNAKDKDWRPRVDLPGLMLRC